MHRFTVGQGLPGSDEAMGLQGSRRFAWRECIASLPRLHRSASGECVMHVSSVGPWEDVQGEEDARSHGEQELHCPELARWRVSRS